MAATRDATIPDVTNLELMPVEILFLVIKYILNTQM